MAKPSNYLPELLHPRDNTSSFLGGNFLSLAYHSSIVIGNTLYIDGGEVSWFIDGTPSAMGTRTSVWPLNETLAIDLSQSWNPQSVTFQSFSKANGAPILNEGALWAAPDNESFYTFGGSPSLAHSTGVAPPSTFWKFSQGQWLQVADDGNTFPSLITRPSTGMWTAANGIGYFLGGYDGINVFDPFTLTPVPGMVSYDMKANTWTNSSTNAYSKFGTGLVGAMQYVPNFGPEGLLITMGGEWSQLGSWVDNGISGGMASNFNSFWNVTIYDPASKTWYWQDTNGATGPNDVPGGASMFCHTGAQSSDSTYEM